MIDISVLCTHNVYSFIFSMESAVQITTFQPILLFRGFKGKCSSETCSLHMKTLTSAFNIDDCLYVSVNSCLSSCLIACIFVSTAHVLGCTVSSCNKSS